MTIKQKLKELDSHFAVVSVLSDKNDCRVIRMRHRNLNRDVVIHTLSKKLAVYETLCSLCHDALPNIYDCFALDDGMLVIEEYIEGVNLAEIASTGRFRKSGIKKILKAVCCALEILHENGIIHRDIKPENIMVTSKGRIVLIDFNAARIMSLSSRDTEIFGTVGYASPEQLGLAQTDPRTDIYAMGILLNVLLTGNHPSVQIACGRYGRIVKKCTAVNPNNRYKSIRHLKRAL